MIAELASLKFSRWLGRGPRGQQVIPLLDPDRGRLGTQAGVLCGGLSRLEFSAAEFRGPESAGPWLL